MNYWSLKGRPLIGLKQLISRRVRSLRVAASLIML
ncbi:unnamed protein product [Schistosoma curassoni]|uniref:ABC transporter permease n=1 Tax=Schistosoma curassoni TaxID=6186 RepID=A0A183KQI0_9TREM|nr:unnamed protein product [Schistosoma curassoni]